MSVLGWDESWLVGGGVGLMLGGEASLRLFRRARKILLLSL